MEQSHHNLTQKSVLFRQIHQLNQYPESQIL